jgi:hypothetical protein
MGHDLTPVILAHTGPPCDPPIVNGVVFHRAEGNLWLGEADEATAQFLTRIPGFSRYGGKLKVNADEVEQVIASASAPPETKVEAVPLLPEVTQETQSIESTPSIQSTEATQATESPGVTGSTASTSATEATEATDEPEAITARSEGATPPEDAAPDVATGEGRASPDLRPPKKKSTRS